MLAASLPTPWAEELLHGTVQAADEAGTSVVVSTVVRRAVFAGLAGAGPRHSGTDGALLVLHLPDSGELQRLAAARIPLVVIDPPEEPGPGIQSVGTTNWQGGLTATRHLIELGHRRIAIIGGPEQLWSSRARLAGYRAALEAAGLPAAGELIRQDDFCTDGGRRQGRGRWPWPSRPPPSSPGTIRRRSACSPSVSGGCGPPTTSAWSASRRPSGLVGHSRAHHYSPAPRAMAATAFRMLHARPALVSRITSSWPLP